MFNNEEEKTLISITRDFTGEYDDELTVYRGAIVQFVRKIDRMWFEVYYDGTLGKVPMNCCQEWRQEMFERMKIVKNSEEDQQSQQAIFVSKYDFMSDLQSGDLKFAANEILVGLYMTNDNWWYGARYNSVRSKQNSLTVKQEDCGIFPITHCWRVREDLLPSDVFTTGAGITVEEQEEEVIESNDNTPNFHSAQHQVPESQELPPKSPVPSNSQQQQPQDVECMFYVKVHKTMKSQIAEEIDLDEVGEILSVLSIPDKLYFYGQSLDGRRKGIFPKSFVKVVEDSPRSSADGSNSTLDNEPVDAQTESTVPPVIAPPPLPPTVGQFIEAGFEEIGEDPPSYDVAMKEAPIYCGYSNQMLDEIESYGKVLYDFNGQQDNELTVHQNQIVRLIRHVDHEWLECEKDTRIGFVPKSYIKIIVDCERSDENEKTSASNHEVAFPPDTYAEAIQDFVPEFDHDLPISRGDRLELLSRYTNTDWAQAKDVQGRVGLVPLTYLKILQGSPTLSQQDSVKEPIIKSQQRSAPPAPPTSSSSTTDFDSPPYPPAFPTFNQFLQDEKQAPDVPPVPSLNPQMVPPPLSLPSTSQASDLQSEPVKSPSVRQASHRVQQRQCIITELIQTEKDYCSSIGVFVRVIRHLSEIERPKGFESARIVGDMEEVVKVSKCLLKLLDNNAKDRSHCDQRVGMCFLQIRHEIHDAYMNYCKNHDDLNELLNTYQADRELAPFLQQCEKRIQDEINCFNLAAVVIKPVQRILKYPLLLNELINCTEQEHIDRRELESALEMITNIASNINELKRRQDLVEKYCKPSQETSVFSKLTTLNRHTLAKKMGRMKTQLISLISSSMFEDKEYDDIQFRFQHVEKTIHQFADHLQKYVSHAKDYHVKCLYVSNAYIEYMGKRSDAEFWREAHNKSKQSYEEFKRNIELHVVAVLKKLLTKYKNPNILLRKRQDKRLDYEQTLKSKPDAGDLTESHFLGLNIQLKEELPALTELSLNILANCMRCLISAYRKYHTRIAHIFIYLHDDLPDLKNVPTDFYENIEQNFRVKHHILHEQMYQDFSILRISDSTSHTNHQHTLTKKTTWVEPVQIVPSIPSPRLGDRPNELSQQDHNQKSDLKKRYADKDLQLVMSKNIPNGPGELYVESGDLVGVIKYKDPMGIEERYFVDRGGNRRGVVPKNILKPYQRHVFETQTSLTEEIVPVLKPSLHSSFSTSSQYQNLPHSSNISQDHCYDQVPTEDDQPNSLLSFDEIDSSKNVSNNILEQFDPLVSSKIETFIAGYDFKAQDSNQLSLKKGQSVRIKQKFDMKGNREWWLVEDLQNRSGYVPANYLLSQ